MRHNFLRLVLALALALSAFAVVTRPTVSIAAGDSDGPSVGQPTLVESATTSSSETFQNPDGTLTTEVAASPVRYQDPSGDWQDIDTTLIHRDGSWTPRSAPIDIAFSDGGDTTFVDLERDGGDAIEFNWPDTLPAPEVDGNSLTYRGAVDGGDLVVTALPNGFSHSIVLNERPTSADEVTIPLPIELDGTKLTETSSGGLAMTSSDDTALRAPHPVMWDSSDLASDGLPAETVPVDAAVTSGNAPTLTITPDKGFLMDPNTVYPVTIDPTFTTYNTPSGDAFIENTGSYQSATSTNALETLRSGTQDGGTKVARSLIRFPDFDLSGKDIQTATLKVHMIMSPTCTATPTYAYRVTSNWLISSLNWANQPSVETSPAPPQFSAAYGGPSGCAAKDWASWNVLPTVQAWQGGAQQFGFRLSAVNQTSNSYYRWFRSDNGTPEDPNDQPKLTVTYIPYPSTPTDLEVTTQSGGYVTTLTPSIQATVAGGNGLLTGQFDVIDVATNAVIWSGSNTQVSAGASPWVDIPAGVLTYAKSYKVRVRATDGVRTSGYATGTTFKVVPETVSVPAGPCESPCSPITPISRLNAFVLSGGATTTVNLVVPSGAPTTTDHVKVELSARGWGASPGSLALSNASWPMPGRAVLPYGDSDPTIDPESDPTVGFTTTADVKLSGSNQLLITNNGTGPITLDLLEVGLLQVEQDATGGACGTDPTDPSACFLSTVVPGDLTADGSPAPTSGDAPYSDDEMMVQAVTQAMAGGHVARAEEFVQAAAQPAAPAYSPDALGAAEDVVSAGPFVAQDFIEGVADEDNAVAAPTARVATYTQRAFAASVVAGGSGTDNLNGTLLYYEIKLVGDVRTTKLISRISVDMRHQLVVPAQTKMALSGDLDVTYGRRVAFSNIYCRIKHVHSWWPDETVYKWSNCPAAEKWYQSTNAWIQTKTSSFYGTRGDKYYNVYTFDINPEGSQYDTKSWTYRRPNWRYPDAGGTPVWSP